MLTFMECLMQAIVGRARFDKHTEHVLERDFLRAMEQKAQSGCPKEREMGVEALARCDATKSQPSPLILAVSITPSFIHHKTLVREKMIEEGFEELLGPLTFADFVNPREFGFRTHRKEAKLLQDMKHEPEHLRHAVGFINHGFEDHIRIPRRQNMRRSSLEALEPLWNVKKPGEIVRAPKKFANQQLLVHPAQRLIAQQQQRPRSALLESQPLAEQKLAKSQKLPDRSRLVHSKQKTLRQKRQQYSIAKPRLAKWQLALNYLKQNTPPHQQQQHNHKLPNPPQSQPHPLHQR